MIEKGKNSVLLELPFPGVEQTTKERKKEFSSVLSERLIEKDNNLLYDYGSFNKVRDKEKFLEDLLRKFLTDVRQDLKEEIFKRGIRFFGILFNLNGNQIVLVFDSKKRDYLVAVRVNDYKWIWRKIKAKDEDGREVNIEKFILINEIPSREKEKQVFGSIIDTYFKVKKQLREERLANLPEERLPYKD